METKTYKVNVTFMFNGCFFVKADNIEEARTIVHRDCGLCMGGDIHTSNPEQVIDWEFDVQPDKIVGYPVCKTK